MSSEPLSSRRRTVAPRVIPSRLRLLVVDGDLDAVGVEDLDGGATLGRPVAPQADTPIPDSQVTNLDGLDSTRQTRSMDEEGILEPAGLGPRVDTSRAGMEPAAQACGWQATGYGTRVAEPLSREARKALGQAVVRKPLRSLKEPKEDALRLIVAAVSSEALPDQRVIVGPHRPEVVADRMVGGRIGGSGSVRPSR